MSAPKQKTVVQWLEKEFVKLESTIGIHGVMYELIEQAKAMEKEQIMDAYVKGQSDCEIFTMQSEAEQYYNETYETI